MSTKREEAHPRWSAGSLWLRGRGGTPFRIPPRWWTRSERIRTASEVALSFPLTEAEPPTYQRIAREAERLRALGLSLNRIAEHLGVDGKTVGKALAWLQKPAS
jgi:hypothetical protein